MPQSVQWNLLLAAIPAALGIVVAWGLAKKGGSRRLPLPVTLLIAGVWFAFLPNSCYLLTEWRHLLMDRRWDAMLPGGAEYHVQMYALATWAVFYLAYSGAGVLLFTLAIRPVEKAVRATSPRLLLIAPAFFFLVSLGVYMGLIVRLNSWDIATHPSLVVSTVRTALTNHRLLGAIAVFAAMLWVLYELVDIWVDAVAARFGRGGGSRGK